MINEWLFIIIIIVFVGGYVTGYYQGKENK